jgi:uncharacterized membrane protein
MIPLIMTVIILGIVILLAIAVSVWIDIIKELKNPKEDEL